MHCDSWVTNRRSLLLVSNVVPRSNLNRSIKLGTAAARRMKQALVPRWGDKGTNEKNEKVWTYREAKMNRTWLVAGRGLREKQREKKKKKTSLTIAHTPRKGAEELRLNVIPMRLYNWETGHVITPSCARLLRYGTPPILFCLYWNHWRPHCQAQCRFGLV